MEFSEKQPTEGIGVAICYPDTLNITSDSKWESFPLLQDIHALQVKIEL